MKDYTIVTISSHVPTAPYYCYNEFFESLGKFKKEPLLIQPERWGGLGTKPRELYKAIKDGRISTKYLIFCDCWDLVFVKNPDKVMEWYQDSFYAPWVCSAEKNCFPADLKDEYDALNPPTSYKYLNSGFIVAETEAMLTVLESMDAPNIPEDYRKDDGNMCHVNDQELFQIAFLKQPVEMVLDYWQHLSQTMCNVTPDELDIGDAGIVNLETITNPMSIHWNGGSKTEWSREIILKSLGL